MTSTPAALAFRDFETDGVSGSGVHQPVKSEIRALFAGVLANSPRSVSVPYTVDAITDPGATLGVTGSGTLTYSAASGYQGTHTNLVVNQGTRRVTVAPTGATAVKLYPGQWCIVYNFSGAWFTTPAQRYIWNGVALQANSATGNDTTGDGMATGSGAYATLTRGVQAIFQDFDLNNGSASLTASGTFPESVTAAGQPTGNNLFFITGISAGGFTWKAGASGFCFLIGDNAEAEITNTTFDGNGINGSSGISGHQPMVVDFLSGNKFNAFPGGVHAQCDHGPSVFNFSANYEVAGPAAFHMVWGPGGNISHAGGLTVTITGTPTIGTWLKMVASQMLFSGGVAYVGSITAGCVQFSLDFLSLLLLGGTTLPGSVSGSSAHGSQVL